MRQSALDHKIEISVINQREAWGYEISACDRINIGECDKGRKAASLEVIPSLFFSSQVTQLRGLLIVVVTGVRGPCHARPLAYSAGAESSENHSCRTDALCHSVLPSLAKPSLERLGWIFFECWLGRLANDADWVELG